ncbi:MAG: type II toxin-antitoxin system YafO family toxin [Saccharospirillum sp.]
MRIFKGLIFRQQLSHLEQEALVQDFKRYKTTGDLPDTFGRDAPFDHPHTLPLALQERVFHLHLASANVVWKSNTPQYARTSDEHLIYCAGAVEENCFLLIAILSPDAHQQARDNNVMYKLARTAELFRMKH